MTEKTLKKFKNKNKTKNLKLKNPIVPKESIEVDSDISESETTGKAPKIDKKALKQISSEVTDLLASLKKEHGIVDASGDEAQGKKDKADEKVNKTKKDIKNVQNPAADGGNKKAKLGQKPEKKLPAQQNKGKEKGNKKQQLNKNAANTKNQEADAIVVTAEPQDDSPTKKKKKNKKRAANDATVSKESNDGPATKKVKPNQNQNQNQKPQTPQPNAKKAQDNDAADSEQTDEKKGLFVRMCISIE